MSENFFEKFRINNERETVETVFANIEKGVNFRGTNLWILIFAIFVASLGLNVNSTAVIIGAMLISPLMGPIMGIGLGIGITDLGLVRKALYNYGIAVIVALITSTIFFLLSPLNDAHSEILARTSPNIYDVLIAFFGGLAGIVATTSKQKGNVIPGVAIATALMPPLCTAGYGLATLQLNFFLGAFYLFIINTVFIAFASLITIRILRFPYHHLRDARAEKIARNVITLVVLVTLMPSLYFGYDMVQQKRFSDNASRFITNEAHFTNDYLLNKKIDAKKRTISLVFGGNKISDDEIATLTASMKKYELNNTTLDVKQGFSYLTEDKITQPAEQVSNLSIMLAETEKQKNFLQSEIDSIKTQKELNKQVYDELKSQYLFLKTAVIEPSVVYTDSAAVQSYFVVLSASKQFSGVDKARIENWLKVRLKQNAIKLIFQ